MLFRLHEYFTLANIHYISLARSTLVLYRSGTAFLNEKGYVISSFCESLTLRRKLKDSVRHEAPLIENVAPTGTRR